MKKTTLLYIAIAALAVLLIGVSVLLVLNSAPKDEDEREEASVMLGAETVEGTRICYSPMHGYLPTDEEAEAMVESLRARTDGLGYKNARVYSYDDDGIRFIVDIPGESVAQNVIDKMCAIAELTFRDYNGDVLLNGSDIDHAAAQYGDQGMGVSSWYVSLTLKEEAVSKFAAATEKVSSYSDGKNYIAICLDEIEITAPTVTQTLTQKDIMITGSFDEETAKYYAGVIDAGALPFAIQLEYTEESVFELE